MSRGQPARRAFRCWHVEFAVKRNLAPVPLNQNIAAPLVSPVMRYPVGTRPWRLFPPSPVPGVSVAIITMVPGNPHMVTAGPPHPPFSYSTGWRDANYNIGRRSAEDQRACKNQSYQSLKKHNTLSVS
jgi:hypothetical protein